MSRLLLSILVLGLTACASNADYARHERSYERVVVLRTTGVDPYARLFAPLAPYLYDPWYQPGFVWGVSYYPRPIWHFVGARHFDPFWGWYWPYDVRFGAVWPYHVYGYGFWGHYGPVWYGPGWFAGRPLIVHRPWYGDRRRSADAAQDLADQLRGSGGMPPAALGYGALPDRGVEFEALPEPGVIGDRRSIRSPSEWPEPERPWRWNKPAVSPPSARPVPVEVQSMPSAPSGMHWGQGERIERIEVPQYNVEAPRWQPPTERRRESHGRSAPRHLDGDRGLRPSSFERSFERSESPRWQDAREVDPR